MYKNEWKRAKLKWENLDSKVYPIALDSVHKNEMPKEH
jgi:hypothetical protein